MDPLTTSALVAAGGDLLGGIMGSSGVKQTNAANLAIARENRAFQERMSSTAYQRATEDLEKAGLNRILALGSPASSPGGAMATMQNPKAPLQKGVSQAAHSAMDFKMKQEQIHLMASQAGQLDAAAANQSEQASNAARQREVIDRTALQLDEMIKKIVEETKVVSARAIQEGTKATAYDFIPDIIDTAIQHAPPSYTPILESLKDKWMKRNAPK